MTKTLTNTNDNGHNQEIVEILAENNPLSVLRFAGQVNQSISRDFLLS
jgi:hypothetical protein